MYKVFYAAISLFVLIGCGGGGGGGDNSGGSGLNTNDVGVFETYPGGIARINWDGQELLGNTGGYYIIGTCPGYGDDPNINFTSFGVYDGMLNAPSPAKCPASPFSITFTQVAPNVVDVFVTVGPMTADASTVSVPLDADKTIFDRFEFAGNRYWVGGCSSPQARSGSGGLFSDIPQDCIIPNFGRVGVAFTRVPVAWGEIESPYGTIRREILDLGGDVRQILFYNHPNTHNVEFGLGPMKRGEVAYVHERITVY